MNKNCKRVMIKFGLSFLIFINIVIYPFKLNDPEIVFFEYEAFERGVFKINGLVILDSFVHERQSLPYK